MIRARVIPLNPLPCNTLGDIAVKQEFDDSKINVKVEECTTSDASHSTAPSPGKAKKTSTKTSKTTTTNKKKKEEGKPNSKHIIKNYGKAMITFACSDLAKPYLKDIVGPFDVSVKEFQDYIKGKRESVDSMKSIRDLLLVKSGDSNKQEAYKKIFQSISIAFIKYYSVNWVFQGKMTYKQAHINARFKMLRRIQDPQHFTYFKDFNKI